MFESSYKFMVNKNFNVHSKQFELIRLLNADPAYQQYVKVILTLKGFYVTRGIIVRGRV